MLARYSNLLRFILMLALVSAVYPNAWAASGQITETFDLDSFSLRNLNQRRPPCDSPECRLARGTVAAALGDIGEYARQMGAAGMNDYAKAAGIEQDFVILRSLEKLPPASPSHINERFSINIKNINSIKTEKNDELGLLLDSRPIIEIKINNIPLDMILDSGASLTIPITSPVADSLDTLPIKLFSTAGAGAQQVAKFSTAKTIKVGRHEIKNLMANIVPQVFSSYQAKEPIGLVGFELLLRFDAVSINFQNGRVEFNPEFINNNNCTAMSILTNKNKMIAGIAAKVLIDGRSFKARIDTGANFDAILHGRHLLADQQFSPTEIKLIDGSGALETLEYSQSEITIGSETSTHNFVRTSARHENFDITLGAKFFINKIITFDFRRQKFCINK